MSQRSRALSQPLRMDRLKQGPLDSYFTETRRSGMAGPKMAPERKAARHHKAPAPELAASTIPLRRSVSVTAPPASPGSLSSQEHGLDLADLMGDGDLKCLIWSLPTREDLERFTARIEKAFTQDIAQLKEDTTHLGGRLETLEQRFDALPHIAMLQEKCTAQSHRMEALISQMDDFENCTRCANISINGMPEAAAPKDIIPPTLVEIDRAHRAL